MKKDNNEYFSRLYDFQNLYKAHLKARKGKRSKREVANFELNLSSNLVKLSQSLRDGTYVISGYYSFLVFEPKRREIHALHYIDRVVQHCLCDEILEPVLDKRLIYDNTACRKGKGTHFALKRVSHFLIDYYRKNKTNDGYFLKCDIRKFFDSIDHDILKQKLCSIFADTRLLNFLFEIIDSYQTSPNKGIPMGNQTSQWFAIFYLDELDRVIKENLSIKYYVRYMDDFLLISSNKKLLSDNLKFITWYLNKNLKLELNAKTQIIPMKNGVNFLGFHFYILETGKILKKVSLQTKMKFKRRILSFVKRYSEFKVSYDEIYPSYISMFAHLEHGTTYQLATNLSQKAIFRRKYFDKKILK